MNVDIYLRNADSGIGHKLTEWPADNIAGLFSVLKHWGITDADGDDLTDLCGQFRLTDEAAYFEVILER